MVRDFFLITLLHYHITLDVLLYAYKNKKFRSDQSDIGVER